MAETMFKDLGSYKNKIINALLNNPDVMKCVFNSDTYTDNDIDNVVYKQIFPYLYINNDTQLETKTYICIELDPTSPTSTIKDSKLIIWEYCSKEIMKYSKVGYNGTRADILADMIESTIRPLNLGIGEPEIKSANYFMPGTDYYGRVLIYDIPDFKIKDR